MSLVGLAAAWPSLQQVPSSSLRRRVRSWTTSTAASPRRLHESMGLNLSPTLTIATRLGADWTLEKPLLDLGMCRAARV